jgi:hypothetical protein
VGDYTASALTPRHTARIARRTYANPRALEVLKEPPTLSRSLSISPPFSAAALSTTARLASSTPCSYMSPWDSEVFCDLCCRHRALSPLSPASPSLHSGADLGVELVVAQVQRGVDGLERLEIDVHFLLFAVVCHHSPRVQHEPVLYEPRTTPSDQQTEAEGSALGWKLHARFCLAELKCTEGGDCQSQSYARGSVYWRSCRDPRRV